MSMYVCWKKEKKEQIGKKIQYPSLVFALTSMSLCLSSSSSHPLLFFMLVLFEILLSCTVDTRNSELSQILHVWISNFNNVIS